MRIRSTLSDSHLSLLPGSPAHPAPHKSRVAFKIAANAGLDLAAVESDVLQLVV